VLWSWWYRRPKQRNGSTAPPRPFGVFFAVQAEAVMVVVVVEEKKEGADGR
jgi:hypothetical protein